MEQVLGEELLDISGRGWKVETLYKLGLCEVRWVSRCVIQNEKDFQGQVVFQELLINLII